jgi:hypothetical protein
MFLPEQLNFHSFKKSEEYKIIIFSISVSLFVIRVVHYHQTESTKNLK